MNDHDKYRFREIIGALPRRGTCAKLFIRLDVTHASVDIPLEIRQRYAFMLPIVIENSFYNLEMYADTISVELCFGTVWHTIGFNIDSVMSFTYDGYEEQACNKVVSLADYKRRMKA